MKNLRNRNRNRVKSRISLVVVPPGTGTEPAVEYKSVIVLMEGESRHRRRRGEFGSILKKPDPDGDEVERMTRIHKLNLYLELCQHDLPK